VTDPRYRWALEPKYNETHPFRNGVARVHVGGRLRQDAVHAPPVWEGGEWQLIDRKGTVLKRSKAWLEYEDAKGKPNARNRWCLETSPSGRRPIRENPQRIQRRP